MDNGPRYMSEKNDLEEKIGEALVRVGAMTEEQVIRVLKIQRESAGLDKLFGEIAVDLEFVDEQTIEEMLDQGVDE